MITDDTIRITLNAQNIRYYRNLGYKCNPGDSVIILIDHLSSGSNYKINVKCDFCGKEKQLLYHKYLKNTKNNSVKYSCSNKCSVKKYKDTCIEKYGVENIFQLQKIKIKSKKTKFEKYGDENYSNKEKKLRTIKEKEELYKKSFSSEEFYKICEEIINDEEKWKLYRKISARFLIKSKKVIFNNWNGFDFYDGEYIKNYFLLNRGDRRYPTIDHVLSIREGFRLGIDPEEISSIKNLVITKRAINSSKGWRTKDISIIDNFNINNINSVDRHIKNGTYDTWEIININGTKIIVNNLKNYCEENGLLYNSMLGINKNIIKKHKGWISIIKLTNNITT